jgi:iron complex transport system substrate-binding protein
LNRRATSGIFRAAATLLLLAATGGTAQAAERHSPQTTASPATFRTVSDELGRTIRIPVPVRRIVSLAPSMTETLYALGVEDLLVGDTDFCDYPPAALTKHKVGGVINPSLEEIASLKPDIVLVTKALNRLETVQALDRIGIPAYATDPHTLAEIRSSVRKLADVLGNPAAGDALGQKLAETENSLGRRLQNLPAARVLFVVWTDPLISVGRHTFIADAIAHSGAISVVQSPQDWPQMSLEEMVRLQPEFLVFASNHSETVARDLEALAKRPGWSDLEAVRRRRFAVVSDAVNRPAPRLFAAVEELARQLHPQAFANENTPSPAVPAENTPAGKPPVDKSPVEKPKMGKSRLESD